MLVRSMCFISVMLFVVLEFILSLFFTVAQFVVFCAVWTAFVVGVFVVLRMLLSAYLNPSACNLVAFSVARQVFISSVPHGHIDAFTTLTRANTVCLQGVQSK